MKTHYHQIPKSKLGIAKDLFKSLRIIGDSLDLLKQGKVQQINVIYSQLRALTVDKSTKPLLFHFSDLMNYDLNIYYKRSAIDEKFPDMDLSFHLSGPPLSTVRVHPNQEEISLKSFLDEKVLTINNQKFTVRKIIQDLGNTQGSHYASKLPKYIVETFSLEFNRLPIIDQFVFQLAELIYKLGVDAMRFISEYEHIFNFYLPNVHSNGEEFIFDCIMKNKKNRMSLIYKDDKFHYGLVDTFGFKEFFSIDELVSRNCHKILSISHILNEDFTSEIQIYINDVKVLKRKLSYPLFVINDIKNYDRYINSSFNHSNNTLEFGYFEEIFVGRVVSNFERLELFQYFEQQQINLVPWIYPDGYGFSEAGIKDIAFHGTVPNVDPQVLNL